MILPYLLLCGGFRFTDMTVFSGGILGIVGVVHTGIAHALYFVAMETLHAQTVAILSYLDPVLSLLLSALILRKKLDVFSITGAVLILGSALYSELPSRKNS